MTMDAILSREAAELIGVLGFSVYVLNYVLISCNLLNSNCCAYYVMNLCAASMVLIGLTASFNFASFLIQAFWIVISLFGIFYRLRIRNPQTV